jgi:uncharacterized membrane protein
MPEPVALHSSTTADERTMATLAHVLQVVASWLAPLIILLIRRQSRFVSFHALQAVLLQVVYMVMAGGLFVLWFSSFFVAMATHAAPRHGPPPTAFFMLVACLALGLMIAWAVMLVLAIMYGVKAGRGEWAEYPLLGSLARRILKLGPYGTPLVT